MATRKAAGSAKNLTDSNAQYLGVKKHDGEIISSGNIIVKQRGAKIMAGKNTQYGKDYTVFAVADGKVKFSNRRVVGFNGKTKSKKVVSVL